MPITRIVRAIYPNKEEEYVELHSCCNVYNSVEAFREAIKSKREKPYMEIPLSRLINLHNADGIKNMDQIKGMIEQIRSNRDILESDGLPNVKIIRTIEGDYVLFDGHHSLLAYMYTGVQYLHELPFLFVDNIQGYTPDNDIHVFFGPHGERLGSEDWRNYCINKRYPFHEQLCERIQKVMKDLFNSLKGQLGVSLDSGK